MKRLRALWLSALLLVPAQAFAQAQGMPAGHPAVANSAEPPQDTITPAPQIPVGTIVVKLVNPQGEPLPNADVKLGIQFQKIAEGEQHTEKHAKTDASGFARFDGLATGGDFSYRVSARSGPAEYASDPIQLKPDMGVMAQVHVYPVTRSPDEAAVGAIGYAYVQTRDDVFQIEVLFRYGNRSNITWVPENARMTLPEGFKAFKAGESMGDARFEEDPGRGVTMLGTFAPGQQSVSFQFQVPRHGESAASFHLGLPPHVGEFRFIVEAAPGMEIDVEGFEKPRNDTSQTGQRLLVTRRVAVRGQASGLAPFTASISGIPTPSSGRWVAVLIAGALGLLGVAAFRGKLGDETQADLQQRDAERARGVLLDELVELTRARQEDRIGPSIYESARRSLVEALARIVATNPGLGKKAKAGTKAARGTKAKKGAAA